MSTFQNFKSTFIYNLTCIFLSLRAKFKKPLCPRTPVICPKNSSSFKYRVCVTLAIFALLFLHILRSIVVDLLKKIIQFYFFHRLSHCRILTKRNLLSTGSTIFWSIKKNLSELSMRTWTLRLVLFSCPISNGVVNK